MNLHGAFSKGSCGAKYVLLCTFELHAIEIMRNLCVLLHLNFLNLCYGERVMKGIERELLK